MSNKVYLGDGVYAEHDDYQIKLTAEDGVSVQSVIYLEPCVLEALILYYQNKLK